MPWVFKLVDYLFVYLSVFSMPRFQNERAYLSSHMYRSSHQRHISLSEFESSVLMWKFAPQGLTWDICDSLQHWSVLFNVVRKKKELSLFCVLLKWIAWGKTPLLLITWNIQIFSKLPRNMQLVSLWHLSNHVTWQQRRRNGGEWH